MADMDIQRKKTGGMGWLWGLLALVLLALIIWWIWPDDEEVVEDPEVAAEMAPLPAPIAEAPAVTIGDVLGNPGAYVGQTFPRAEVTVAEVPTDRGFWIEDNGQRLFAVIIDDPAEQPKDINPGQTLRIDQGTLRDATFISNIQGAPLDSDTESIARQQDAYLVVDERHIHILEAGTT